MPGAIRVFLANQYFEAKSAPGQVRTHAASGVGLDHGIHTYRFENAFCNVCVCFRCKGLYNDQSSVVHDADYTPAL